MDREDERWLGFTIWLGQKAFALIWWVVVWMSRILYYSAAGIVDWIRVRPAQRGPIALAVALVASAGIVVPVATLVANSPMGDGTGVTSAATAAPIAATEEQAVQQTLSRYFNAVNNRDYETAWQQYTAQEQARLGSEQQYAQGESTTHVSNTAFHGIVSQSPGVALVSYSFTSTQAPANAPDGQSCDNWSLVYAMVYTGTTWLIDNAKGENGVGYRPC
jgi:hypothetical protein